jgi:hypothetical protein
MDLPDAILDYVYKNVDAHLKAQQPWKEVSTYSWQCIRALAYLYVHERSPMKKSPQLPEAIASLFKTIKNAAEPPDNRMVGHLAEARELLGPALVKELMPDVDAVLKAGAEPMVEKLRSYRYLTHFTSGNQGTSTNHSAVFCASIYRVGMIWNNREYQELAASTMERLAKDMEPDGFWAETTGGPTPLYNNLTFCCVGRMARFTGNAAWREAALRGAQFHRRFCYPDGTDIETIDGRCRYNPYPSMWGWFVHSETPEGRAYVRRKMETIQKVLPPRPFDFHGGELASLLSENHQHWITGPLGKAECERENFTEQLQIAGGLRKQGPWVASLQGIQALPRGWGTFTIDRTGLLSLWHEKTGLIVNGSGEPGEHPAQTFQFHIKTEIVQHVVPERTRLNLGQAGSGEPARILADFRGGTASLELHFVSENEVKIAAAVFARVDRYPIPFTLALELRDGATVNGRLLGQEKLELSSSELGGRLDAGKFSIQFSAEGASFLWPHDPYNPYDMEKHKSGRDKYVSLLKIPVGPQGVEVTIGLPPNVHQGKA